MNVDNTNKKKKKEKQQKYDTSTFQTTTSCDNNHDEYDKKEQHYHKRQCVLNRHINSYKDIEECESSSDSDVSSVITTTSTIIATTPKGNKVTDDCKWLIIWEKMYESLVEYIRFEEEENNGTGTIPWDGNVPQHYKTPNDGIRLGFWIKYQRAAKWNGTLHPAREEKLTNIGLKWKVKKYKKKKKTKKTSL